MYAQNSGMRDGYSNLVFCKLYNLNQSLKINPNNPLSQIDLEKLEDMRKRIMVKRKQRAKYT